MYGNTKQEYAAESNAMCGVAPERAVQMMDFGGALQSLKEGWKLSRLGWNGRGMYIQLQRPDHNSKMQRPYIFIDPGPGWMVPWTASQADLLADDWHRVP